MMDWFSIIGGLIFGGGMYFLGRVHEKNQWAAMIQYIRDKHPEIDAKEMGLELLGLEDLEIREGDVLVARKPCGCISSAYVGDMDDAPEVDEWFRSVAADMTVTAEPGPVGVTIPGGCPHGT